MTFVRLRHSALGAGGRAFKSPRPDQSPADSKETIDRARANVLQRDYSSA
jgi:hypothetical protein